MTMMVPLPIKTTYARWPDGKFKKHISDYNSHVTEIPLVLARTYNQYLTVRKFRRAVKNRHPVDYDDGIFNIKLYPKIVDGRRITMIGEAIHFIKQDVEFE